MTASKLPHNDGSLCSRAQRSASLVALCLLLVVGFVACNQSTSGSQASATVYVPPSAQDLQQTVINVINVAQPSVVQITGQSSQGGSVGSGEILDSNGYIVTNDHVVSGFSNLSVQLSDGKQYSASLVGASPQDDLAVVRIHASGLRPINIGNSNQVEVGQFAIALGSPLGLEQSATLGIVSALDRSAGEGSGGPASVLVGLIQTSAPINPGNSGGALVDLQGALIGVPTLAVANPESGAAANGIGFAIPSNRVTFVADQLIKYGKLINSGQGYLGIQAVDVTPNIASAYSLPVQSGILVSGFSNDAAGRSPAQQAGIQTSDIIVDVNGQPVANSSALASDLLALAPGTKITVTVVRGSSRPTIMVTLGERPVSAS
ncbi:MAG: S1C family serine protease [Ktedonobacterales bacterium]